MGIIGGGVNPVAALATADEPGEVDSECTPIAIESQATCGAWTREIEELCRALEAQQRERHPGTDADGK